MTDFILNKVLLVVFIMSILNIGYHGVKILQRLREDIPDKYSISTLDRIFLGLSFSYVITALITGLTL
jgi:hypothetical protein